MGAFEDESQAARPGFGDHRAGFFVRAHPDQKGVGPQRDAEGAGGEE